MSKQEILMNIYNKLRITGAIRTRQDFAEKIGYNYSCTSAALNGVERYLNDRFFTRILKAFPQVSEDYVRTGEGSVLAADPETGEVYEKTGSGIVPLTDPRPNAPSAMVERMLDALTEQQALMHRQQEQTDKALEQIESLIGIIRAITGGDLTGV